MNPDFDTIVVGAGVVGLAVARELALSGRCVLALERNRDFGQETSSRNSEVIHSGIYYPQNSHKARLCVRGAGLLYDYCVARNIAHRRTGKLIVATDSSQLASLHTLMQRGVANGVEDLSLLDAGEITALEPQLCAQAAIWSPSTGILDSHQFMTALLADFERANGTLVLASPVTGAEAHGAGFSVDVGGTDPVTVTTRELINCAGLDAQSVSHSVRGIATDAIPCRYLSRGCYFTLSGASPFRHLVYPMPSSEGLGVHLTLDLQGCARFGPDTQWVDTVTYDVDPRRASDFAQAIRRYWPAVEEHKLSPAYAGIRPKIAGPGEDAADFLLQGASVHGVRGWCALYGIESPGMTAALAIAEAVRTELESV